MKLSIKAILRKDAPNTKGECPIIIQMIIDRKQKKVSTGFKVIPEHWSEDEERVSKKISNHFLINSTIQRMKMDLQAKLMERKIVGETVNLDLINQLTKSEESHDFKKYAASVINHMEEKGLRDPATIRVYRKELRKVERFERGSLPFTRINHKWLEEYKGWLQSVCELSGNSIWGNLKFIRMIFNRARDIDKITDHYPFKSFKFKYVENLKIPLSMEEVERLYLKCKEPSLHPSLQLIGFYFLVGCYSGLRFEDLQRLPSGELIVGDRLICVTSKATGEKGVGEIVSIKLTSRLKELIQLIGDRKLISNQKANEYLKILIELAEINKHVTFHTARHSFATIALELAIPIEVVSKILGHRNLKQTATYAKIMDRTVDDAMDRMERAIEKKTA